MFRSNHAPSLGIAQVLGTSLTQEGLSRPISDYLRSIAYGDRVMVMSAQAQGAETFGDMDLTTSVGFDDVDAFNMAEDFAVRQAKKNFSDRPETRSEGGSQGGDTPPEPAEQS